MPGEHTLNPLFITDLVDRSLLALSVSHTSPATSLRSRTPSLEPHSPGDGEEEEVLTSSDESAALGGTEDEIWMSD